MQSAAARETAVRPVPAPVAVGGMLPNLLVAAALFVAPVGFVLVYSLGTLDYDTLSVRWGWSTDTYHTALHAPYSSTYLRSFLVAGATVLACMPFAFAIALVITQAGRRMRVALFLLVLFPFWTSFIVRTYAWTFILGPRGIVADVTASLGHRTVLLGTTTGILIGMVAAYLPIMTLPVYVALSRVPDELVHAARDLGASEWRILRTILVPGAAAGFGAGALLVGIPAAGEYVVPSVLGAGKTALVGNLLNQELTLNGNYPLGAALTIGLILGLAVVLGLVQVARIGLARRA